MIQLSGLVITGDGIFSPQPLHFTVKSQIPACYPLHPKPYMANNLGPLRTLLALNGGLRALNSFI